MMEGEDAMRGAKCGAPRFDALRYGVGGNGHLVPGRPLSIPGAAG